MSNAYAESAAIFVMSDNEVEVVRASSLRRMISTPKEHLLVVNDERQQPVIYCLDTTVFEQEHFDAYGKREDDTAQLAAISEAIFQAVLGGKKFRVKHKQAMSVAGTLTA
jgi:hypothetical protein